MRTTMATTAPAPPHLAAPTRAGLAAHQRYRWRADPAVPLWIVAAGCWGLLVLAGHDHQIFRLGASVLSDPAAAWLFLAFWLEMIGAMMLPTLVPMLRVLLPVSTRAPHRIAVRCAFLAGYAALWMGYAVAALALATALQVIIGSSWLDTRPYAVLATMLAIAGAFQFSPLKNRCLAQCRAPRAFLYQHYQRGVGRAALLGMRHARACLGCCWALMLVMCGTGMASLLAMLLLMVIMLAEKVTPWGQRVAVPVGALLLVTAVVVALFGDAGWGLFMPAHAM